MTRSTSDITDAGAALRRMVEATNAEDRDAFIACFTQDATVDDFGRTFTGRQAILQWSDTENIGTHNRIAIDNTRRTVDGRLHAGITVSGDGYNGTGTFLLTTPEGLIQTLTIRG